MRLEDKLRLLKRSSRPASQDEALARTLESLRRLEEPCAPRKLPAQRAPRGVEEYVEGRVASNAFGEYFLARQALPFGRPYGKLRISDLAACELSSLDLLLEGKALPGASEIVYLDTETTGLAGGTGTLAFLIGLGAVEGTEFVVRQFFLRDYTDEKAALTVVAEALARYRAIVTFNGKTFDLPLLETRFALARMKSPFGRMTHLDLLHPARRLWKLRLSNCELTHLEREILGIAREGDVPGAEIPRLYFDYLRTGSAEHLQPVFFHNALDIVTLAALTVEMATILAGARSPDSSLDLFSLSRIYERARSAEKSVATCARAIAAGLPETVEPRALWQLALQHKRRREHETAVELWMRLAAREERWTVRALEELAIHFEHRAGDLPRALEFTRIAIEKLGGEAKASADFRRLVHRLARLERKSAAGNSRLGL